MNDELLTMADIIDGWAVSRAFLRQHVAHEGRVARVLPELPAIVSRGRLYFTPTAVRAFFRAFAELHRPIRLKRAAQQHAAKLDVAQ